MNNQKSFTVIELLVTIAVIGLLASQYRMFWEQRQLAGGALKAWKAAKHQTTPPMGIKELSAMM